MSKKKVLFGKLSVANSLQEANFSRRLDSCVAAYPLDLRLIFISQDQRKGEGGRVEGRIPKSLTFLGANHSRGDAACQRNLAWVM